MRLPRRPLAGLVLLLAAVPARALGPADVFLIVNKNVPESRQVADHYCAKRGVPADNIITLDLPAGEDISRRDYNTRLLEPLRAALEDRRDKVKVLLSIYGVPLRVGGEEPSAEDREVLAKLQPEIDEMRAELRRLNDEIDCTEYEQKREPADDLARFLKQSRQERDAVQKKLKPLEDSRRWHAHEESHACVDSELSLIWWDKYELRRWQPNLLNLHVPEKARKDRPPLVMTCRLDGPTVDIVKGLVDQAVEVEAKGKGFLEGKVYVDARGIKFDPKNDDGYGYGGYDESLREMAKLLRDEGKMAVTLDDKPGLFAPQSCPDCALYCGWYSLANYVNCCRFNRGAVAYHIASAEAVSLRDRKSKLWCKCLLEDGVAATLGPVAEPYTIGFPKPAEFFGLLATGKYTLVECYHRTALLTSWMTVLVGDPLYNPYAKAPKLTEDKVKPSPAGGKPFWQEK
jgi:uncharacterized protein (TIGR03790 family)